MNFNNYTADNLFYSIPINTPTTIDTSNIKCTTNFTDNMDMIQSLMNNVQYTNTPDENWMPYEYVEYEPRWHKKYAKIKYQMETMWD